ncbi:multicopper oxidase [Trichoderma longibrachiatum ATCC 18648]|uniref:Multicopper oxidase n=1 Tax=Trichoderma longibrachiatum ATCC 18648 TaxID=983965 RepID=A0A2T4BVN3_TRILO|nr:multicopper oxidase [Trichoderma longibrachiatum ATCC 18648]
MRDELEDRRLLDGVDVDSDDLATQPSIDEAREPETEDAAPEVRPKPSFKLVRIAGLVAALCLGSLLVLLFALNRHASGAPWDDSQLAIPLHPTEHSTRDPTTLTFDWHVTLGRRAPDGVEKEVYLINGQFPGPTIEARSGDRIIVRVHNDLKDKADGVSLHWHGLRMQGFNAMDGAVGFTQCPIPAGGSFAYDFRIRDDEHGTFWWHGHSQLQRADGLFGGLVVHEPRHRNDNEAAQDEALLLIGDWFHRRQSDVLDWYSSPASAGNEPVPDSVVINGRGRYDCSMAVPARPVKCKATSLSNFPPLIKKATGETLLRVVNTGSVAGLSVGVDGASLQPTHVDGGCKVDSKPADSIGTLYPGERVDVLLKWKTDQAAEPWFNVYLDHENLRFGNPALNPNHTFPALPKTVTAHDRDQAPPLRFSSSHLDLASLSATEEPLPIATAEEEQTILLYVSTQKLAVYGNKPLGFVNHTVWKPQSLPLLSLNRSSWDENQFVPFIGSGSKPTRVKLVINNLDDGSHPFHLHGYSFHVLSSFRADNAKLGSYNPFETPESKSPGHWKREKPLRKDTVSVPRKGHVVLSFVADNPGMWMLHCHMMVHLGTGMATGFQVGVPEDEEHIYGLDESAARLCKLSE